MPRYEENMTPPLDEETPAPMVPVKEEDALKESPPSAKGRLALLWQRRPRFSDARQKKAGKNLLGFLALLLALTLVARGTAGATLPRVQTSRPETGEISQKVRGTGTVKASGSITLQVPDGLTVKHVPASPGQNVAPGDVLAEFDPEEVNEQLQRARNTLQELQLKLKQLQQAPGHDGSALEAARRSLQRAQQDYDLAKAQGEKDLAAARQALADAQAAEQAARAKLTDPPDETSQEYQDWQAAKAALAEAEAALAQVTARVESELLAAKRALEDAQSSLARAETEDTEAKKQAQDSAAQNSLEAANLQLDIEAQQEKVDLLQRLADDGGRLSAATAGVVQELPAPGAKTGEGNAFRMADTAGGYEAEMWLDEKDAEKLAPGAACQVALSGGSMYYRPTAEGIVTAVGTPGEDGRTRVTVRLPGEDWKAGQTVEAQVLLDRQNHNLCVPLSALHSSNDGYYVLVLREQNTVLGLEYIAAKIPVTVKAQDDQMAAIEGAIGPSDDIITSSSKAVQPDDKVRVAT